MSGSNSVVECQLPKLDVVGSNPISRSIFSTTYGEFRPEFPCYDYCISSNRSSRLRLTY